MAPRAACRHGAYAGGLHLLRLRVVALSPYGIQAFAVSFGFWSLWFGVLAMDAVGWWGSAAIDSLLCKCAGRLTR